MHISFNLGDACEIDWSDATLVFINSTCFDTKLMETLTNRANSLLPGTFVITTTKRYRK